MSRGDLPGAESHIYSTVVIGVDPSSTARHARQEGFKLAKAMGSHVHLVAAFSDGPDGATR